MNLSKYPYLSRSLRRISEDNCCSLKHNNIRDIRQVYTEPAAGLRFPRYPASLFSGNVVILTHDIEAKTHKLSKLRTIYSTGSPLKPESFDFVYEHIKKDVVLGSISGMFVLLSLFRYIA